VEDKTMQKLSPEINKTEIRDRVRGAILGAACANSLGASCIGINYKDIVTTAAISGLRDYTPGLSKSARPDHKPGEILVDALLALSLAESLIANGGKFKAEDLKKRYSVLLENEEFLKASPGAVCLAEMRRMADNLEPFDAGPEALHANAAARAFPAGCLPGPPKTDEAADVAAKQAALTHGDKRSLSAAAVVADSVHFFIAGNRLTNEGEVREYVKREFEVANRFDPRFAESWDDVAPDLDYSQPAEDLPYSLINVESNVNELVPTAVGIFLIFRHSLEEAVCAAARSGGDTDTVSTLVGALSGAYHGASKIPERWLSNLSHKEDFEKIAEAFANLWS
jgi:ADP-ribosylglycohydrolase